MQFAIHVGLAYTAGDELSVLGTEVEDEDFGVHGGGSKKQRRPS
jgi:hypothetical protein